MEEWLKLVYGWGYDTAQPGDAARMRPLKVDDPYIACAVGDEAVVQTAIDVDPQFVNRPGGSLAMPPLVAVTFSSLIRLPEFSEALRRCAKLLLDRGADANQTWINPQYPDSPLSALYGAAGTNHDPELTRILLNAGANPNDNESLYHSVESDDLTCTRLLLDAGAKVTGTNALMRVLDFDNIDGLQLLLSRGGDPNERDGQPLRHAIRRGRSLVHIEMLLEAGADPNAKAHHGTPLSALALLYGLPDIAARLGNVPELTPTQQFVAACASADRERASALLAADPTLLSSLSELERRQLPNLAQNGASEAVQLMVELGWPIDVHGGDWEASALNHAIFRGDPALADFLLSHGAKWSDRHGYGGDVLGTLRYATLNQPVPGGDWAGCARVLRAHGAPVA
jgi:ankyrin repeat protein